VIARIDHLVITVRSVEATCSFYERVLGFERESVAGKPTALHFGSCKISVHQTDRTFEPKASAPTVGSADFCLITEWTLDVVARRLEAENVAVVLGPVDRDGARGPIRSIYFRDPDGNLVEVGTYAPRDTGAKRPAASSAAFGFAVAALLYR
jgi:catechol 2,3-dioxygenase-like lactoylglutathione lyase family enzyme